jgi:hypothetical protein
VVELRGYSRGQKIFDRLCDCRFTKKGSAIRVHYFTKGEANIEIQYIQWKTGGYKTHLLIYLLVMDINGKRQMGTNRLR